MSLRTANATRHARISPETVRSVRMSDATRRRGGVTRAAFMTRSAAQGARRGAMMRTPMMRSPMMRAARSSVSGFRVSVDGVGTKVTAPFFFALAATVAGVAMVAGALGASSTLHAAAFGLLLVLVVAILLGSVVLGVIEGSGRPA